MNRRTKFRHPEPLPQIKMVPVHSEADEMAILPEELELLDSVLDDVITEVVRHGKLRL